MEQQFNLSPMVERARCQLENSDIVFDFDIAQAILELHSEYGIERFYLVGRHDETLL